MTKRKYLCKFNAIEITYLARINSDDMRSEISANRAGHPLTYQCAFHRSASNKLNLLKAHLTINIQQKNKNNKYIFYTVSE